MENLKILPVCTADFTEIREAKLFYVDKTEYLFPLLHRGKPKYFFHRPRRFGKSLTVSTLEALLQGKKHLFEGLWIYDKWDWVPQGVIRFDFSSLVSFENKKELMKEINQLIIRSGNTNGIKLNESAQWDLNFYKLLAKLKSRGPVAILIDEYDSPFHKTLNSEEKLQNDTREGFQEFYSFLKSQETLFDFMFVTGITKIAKTSIFSGMNVLTDISFEPQYAALCGITQSELETYYFDYIEKIANSKNIQKQDLLFSLKRMYNGYRFSHGSAIRVYNPFALNHVFRLGEMQNYWFESGTPTLLIHLIKKTNYDLTFLEHPKLTLSEMSLSYEFSELSLSNLLFQTGYLTIEDVLEPEQMNPTNLSSNKNTTFTLNFPNQEVRVAFMEVILNALREKRVSENELNSGIKLLNAIKYNDWSEFANIWNNLLSHIPAKLQILTEKYYHSLFIFFTRLFEIDSQAERLTSIGQMDLVLEFKESIYIIEFKLNVSAKVALKQIHDRKYFNVYLDKKKRFFLLE